KAVGILRMDLHVTARRIELAQDVRLPGARLRVPLRGGAAAREQDHGKLGGGRPGRRSGRFKADGRAPAGGEEAKVLEEATFGIGWCQLRGGGRGSGEGPLDSAAFPKVGVITDAAEIAGQPLRE